MEIQKLLTLGLMVLLVTAIVFISGCVQPTEKLTDQTATPTPLPTQTTVVPTEKAAVTEYPNAALGGNFSENDKVEYLGVKGTIIYGRIENGKVVSSHLQINDEEGAALVYASSDHPTYGHVALALYPRRGAGGEYDFYDNGELVAIMKYKSDYSFNSYVIAACEPNRFPAQTADVLIKRLKECS